MQDLYSAVIENIYVHSTFSYHLCSCQLGDISLADKLGTGSDEPYQQGTCQFQPDTYDFDRIQFSK